MRRISDMDFGYRVVKEKMPWITDPTAPISGADFDRAELPMVVACTGCQMTMALTSRTCRVDRARRTWCASCAPPMFPNTFRYGVNGDKLSQFVSTARMHATQYRWLMSNKAAFRHDLATNEISKAFATYLRLAAWEVGFRDLSDAMDELRRRMGDTYVFYSEIQALIDEVF